MPVFAFLFACTPDPIETGDTSPPAPVTFSVVGFNIESGGSDAQIVADETIAPIDGVSLWGFVEVTDDADAARLVAGAADEGQDLQYIIGSTGWEDRVVLAWDDDAFALVSSEELYDINVGGTVRAPVVGTMRERSTGRDFLFVVNHLWRTDTAKRHTQAQLLHDWGAAQTLPIVMVGDYNFDWEVDGSDRDAGYDLMTADGVFVWVQPDPIVKSQCSTSYNSVLDFVFVGGDAKTWPATSEILNTDEDYCSYRNREDLSDHRPVRAELTMPG